MKVVLLVVAALAVLPLVLADLPIHCLNSQVAGDWIFTKDQGGRSVNKYGDARNVLCGYPQPDSNKYHFAHPPKMTAHKQVKITLDEPNIATDEAGNKGTWTMVYDEGFEVSVGGVTYFAYNKYSPKTRSSLRSDKVHDYVSHCDETMVGWFRNTDNTNFGCWRGRQVKPRNPWVKATGNTNGLASDDPPVVSPTEFKSSSFLDSMSSLARDVAPESELANFDMGSVSPAHRFRSRRRASDLYAHRHTHGGNQPHYHASNRHVVTALPEIDENLLFEPNYAFIETINNDESKEWSAGVHHQFVGKSMKDMMTLLGARKYKRDDFDVGPGALPTPIVDLRPDSEKYAGLPENWDWTNVQGVSYDTEIRNQGSCGSCYALATISALEARFRVASKNKIKPILSPQEIISCSFYNQACDGGYPYLVAKHAEEFGMVDASCFPYQARSGKCSKSCRTAKRYYVTNVTYVGGFYGGCSEVAIMKEIYEKGPVMIAFQAPPDLFYYTGGIYTGASPKSEEQGVPGVNIWQQTNHAVVAVGWGVDKKTGTKFWKIKNTWGVRWGENGYFRIRRGSNECAIESMASKADVLLPHWHPKAREFESTTSQYNHHSHNRKHRKPRKLSYY